MQFLHILCLLCFALSVTAANSENYEAASAAAAKKGVQLRVGHHYAFKADGSCGHVRLIVGTVFPMINGLDFWADTFEMALTTEGKYSRLYKGASVVVRSDEGWDCSRPQNFRYKGETLEYTRVEIMEMGHRIMLNHNETYSIVSNNCKTFVWELFKKIKVRSHHRKSDSEAEMAIVGRL
ncbi:hypothetical protein MMC30_002689 [Trapelia coarctata]|nr:hypothetical protein [Trapelia coarctata]